MNFIAQTAPTGLTDVLLVPLICFVFGVGIWYGGLHFESRTEKQWVKWLAFIPIAVGLIVGISAFSQTLDYAYRALMPNNKTLYAHYVALALPVIAIGTILGWHMYLKRTGAYEPKHF
jgi:uncharacterized membrane protein